MRFQLIAFDLVFIFSCEDRVQLVSKREGKCRGGIRKSRENVPNFVSSDNICHTPDAELPRCCL